MCKIEIIIFYILHMSFYLYSEQNIKKTCAKYNIIFIFYFKLCSEFKILYFLISIKLAGKRY